MSLKYMSVENLRKELCYTGQFMIKLQNGPERMKIMYVSYHDPKRYVLYVV